MERYHWEGQNFPPLKEVQRLEKEIILKLVICFAICVLKMFTLWLGLRFELPTVMTIHNVVHHHLLTLCTFNS